MLITILSLIILLFSVVLHEIAHGFTAYKLGDPTAKYAGRLSFNPLKHLDPVGSFLFPTLTLILTLGKGPIFGWAKPVPINPNNFKDQKWGQLKVAIAGPAMNFIIAIISGLLIRFLVTSSIMFNVLSMICIYNIFWGLFNLIPAPPLDGSHILFSILGRRGSEIKMIFKQYGFLFLFLILFWGLDFLYVLALKIFSLIVGL